MTDLLNDRKAQKDTMMKIADAMPKDKFDYKSTPPQRSYGEQIMHVALTNVDLLKVLGGKAWRLLKANENRRSKDGHTILSST